MPTSTLRRRCAPELEVRQQAQRGGQGRRCHQLCREGAGGGEGAGADEEGQVLAEAGSICVTPPPPHTHLLGQLLVLVPPACSGCSALSSCESLSSFRVSSISPCNRLNVGQASAASCRLPKLPQPVVLEHPIGAPQSCLLPRHHLETPPTQPTTLASQTAAGGGGRKSSSLKRRASGRGSVDAQVGGCRHSPPPGHAASWPPPCAPAPFLLPSPSWGPPCLPQAPAPVHSAPAALCLQAGGRAVGRWPAGHCRFCPAATNSPRSSTRPRTLTS